MGKIEKMISELKSSEVVNQLTTTDLNEVLYLLLERKKQDDRVVLNATEFVELTKKWGWASPAEFLIRSGFITNPNQKRPRTKIDDATRKSIVDDLTGKILSTREIANKHGITEDSVYNIKSQNGLTKPRPKAPPAILPQQVAA